MYQPAYLKSPAVEAVSLDEVTRTSIFQIRRRAPMAYHHAHRLSTSRPDPTHTGSGLDGNFRTVDLVPVNQAAQDLSLSRETIYRLIRKHNLQIYRRVADPRSYVDLEELRPLLELRPYRRGNEPRPSARAHRSA